jgi:Phosphotransferase enzyme family
MGNSRMIKLEGQPLSRQWATMLSEVHKDVISRLARHVREWRKIRASFLGTVDGGPCPDTIFPHPHSIATYPEAIYGRHESRRDFIQGVVEALRNSWPAGHRDEQNGSTESRILASKEDDRDDHDMVLKHGDFNMSNILVKDGVVTGIFAWGAARYSIEERECLKVKTRGSDLSLEKAADGFVPAFPDKYALWELVIGRIMLYSGIRKPTIKS